MVQDCNLNQTSTREIDEWSSEMDLDGEVEKESLEEKDQAMANLPTILVD